MERVLFLFPQVLAYQLEKKYFLNQRKKMKETHVYGNRN